MKEGESAAEEPVTDEYYKSLEAVEYENRTVTENNEFMFQRAEEPITSDTFSGPVYVSSILEGDNAAGSPGLHYVVFDEGVINNWAYP